MDRFKFMRAWGKPFKRLSTFLLGFFAFIFMIVGILNIPQVKTLALKKIQSYLLEEQHLFVEASSTAFFLPFKFSLYDATVSSSKEEAPFLKANKLSFSLSPLSFLKGRFFEIHLHSRETTFPSPLSLLEKYKPYLQPFLENPLNLKAILYAKKKGMMEVELKVNDAKKLKAPCAFFFSVDSDHFSTLSPWNISLHFAIGGDSFLQETFQLKEMEKLRGGIEAILDLEKSHLEGNYHLALFQKNTFLKQTLSGEKKVFQAKGHVSLQKEEEVFLVNVNSKGSLQKNLFEWEAVGSLEKLDLFFKIEAKQKNPLEKIQGKAVLFPSLKKIEGLQGVFTAFQKEGSFKGSLVWDDKKQAVHTFIEALHLSPLDLKGSFFFFPHSLEMEGKVLFSLWDLSKIKDDADLKSRQLEGFIEGSLDLFKDKGLFTLHANNLFYRDILLEKGTFSFNFKELPLFLKSANVLDLKGKIAISLENLERSNTAPQNDFILPTFKRVLFETTLTGVAEETLPFHLEALAIDPEKALLHASGFFNPYHPQGFSFTLNELQGTVRENPFEISEKAEFILSSKEIFFSSSPFRIGKGFIQGSFHKKEDFFDLSLKGESLPLAITQIVYPVLPAEGVCSFNLFLHLEEGQKEGAFHFTAKDVKVDEPAFESMPPFQGEMDVLLEKDHLKCTAKLKGLGKEPAEIQVDVPLEYTPSSQFPTLAKKLPLKGFAKMKGKLAPLLELMIIDIENITGDLDLEASLSGTLENPITKGSFLLEHGSFEDPTSGLLFRQIFAKGRIEKNTLEIETITATDGEKGKIEGKGSLLINTKRDFPFEFSFHIEDALALRLDFLKCLAFGDVIFKGDKNHGELTGHLIAKKARITIPENRASTLETVKVVYINTPFIKKRPSYWIESNSSWPLLFDLTIKVEDKISIKSKDISSEWEGTIDVKGSSLAPLFYGELKTIKGTYSLGGKVLTIKQGTITFDGDFDKKTSLYILTSLTVDRVTLEMIAKGLLKKPSILFRSNPPMSQKDILSYLLFSRGSSEISSFQGNQLSETITDLNTGANGGPDLLESLKSKIGIDRIDIKNSGKGEDTNVSVQLGKYLFKGTYVSVGQDVNSESTTANIQVDVFQDFKVEAGVGDNATGQLNLLWKIDY